MSYSPLTMGTVRTALALLSGLALAQAPDGPELSLRLVAGDKWTITSKQTFCDPGTTDVAEGFTYRTASVAKAPGKDGYTVEASTELLESRAGETVLPPPKGAKPLVQQIALSRNGEQAVVTDPLSDPIEFRIARLAWFLAPGAGKPLKSERDAWSVSLPGTESGSVPAALATYRIVKTADFEGREAVWVGFGLTEQETDKPFNAKGVFVVDKLTGLVLSGRIDATGVLLPGGDGSRYDLALELSTKLDLKPRSAPLGQRR